MEHNLPKSVSSLRDAISQAFLHSVRPCRNEIKGRSGEPWTLFFINQSLSFGSYYKTIIIEDIIRMGTATNIVCTVSPSVCLDDVYLGLGS